MRPRTAAPRANRIEKDKKLTVSLRKQFKYYVEHLAFPSYIWPCFVKMIKKKHYSYRCIGQHVSYKVALKNMFFNESAKLHRSVLFRYYLVEIVSKRR